MAAAVQKREVAPYRVYVHAYVTLQEGDCKHVDQSNPEPQSLQSVQVVAVTMRILSGVAGSTTTAATP